MERSAQLEQGPGKTGVYVYMSSAHCYLGLLSLPCAPTASHAPKQNPLCAAVLHFRGGRVTQAAFQAEVGIGKHTVTPPMLLLLPCFTSLLTAFLMPCSDICLCLCTLSGPQSCYWVNETARKEMLIRWSEAFSRALLVHCR